MKNRIAALLLAFITALQMMSGVFVAASEETPIVPVDEPKVTVNSVNMILDGEIGLVFHVTVPDEYLDGYVTLTCKGDTVKTEIRDCTERDKNLRYLFTRHLSAIELSEQVCITVYDKNGTSLATMSRSAEDYAKLLRNNARATEAEKKVAETLINYGHYAQLACAEANGWSVGKDCTATTAFYAPTVDASAFSDYAVDWIARSERFEHPSMSLRLGCNTAILLYIPVKEKPTVKVNGKTVEAVPSAYVENTYEIEIPGIHALNLADEYTVEADDAVFKISAFSYYALAAEHSASRNTVDTVRAMYELYDATEKYLASVTK